MTTTKAMKTLVSQESVRTTKEDEETDAGRKNEDKEEDDDAEDVDEYKGKIRASCSVHQSASYTNQYVTPEEIMTIDTESKESTDNYSRSP